MKRTNKLFSALLSLVIIALLVVSVSADNSYTLTIEKETAGHTYEAYQIFKGTLSTDTDDLILSTITWGTGVTNAGKTALGDAQTKANTIKTVADAEDFAKEVEQYLTTVCATAVYNAADKNYTIENLEPGYYLIKDKNDSLPATEGYTAFIMKVVGDATATPKDGNTTVIKNVDDKNDSNKSEDAIEWHDSADHDIGDAIDFKLEATIAENYSEYDTYYLALHDKEEKGLTFDPTSVEVYLDGTLITTGYSLILDPTDDCTFEIVFANLKNTSAQAGSVITVRYKSVLNNDAVLGNKGNVNKVYGEFSNNPNNEDRGKTEDDTVIVFTYKVEVNKVDKDKKPLSGATFTLEKFVANTSGTATYKGVIGEWTALSTVETTPDTKFTFKGLDDGEYRLTETKAPEHYNAIEDPIYFTVNAEHEVEWTMEREDVLTSLTGDVATGEITFTADKEAGELDAMVINERGVLLPETGGIGTVIFYVIGGILVACSIVFIIAKKRMSDR